MLVGVVAPPVPRVSNMIGEVDFSWYAWNLFTVIFNIIILKLFKNTKKDINLNKKYIFLYFFKNTLNFFLKKQKEYCIGKVCKFKGIRLDYRLD